MKAIPSFKRTLARLRNAEHVEFQLSMIKFAKEKVMAVDSLKVLWTAYESAFGAEDLLFVRSQKMQGTDEIIALDKRRDELFVTLKMTVESATRNPSETLSTAGEALAPIIDIYKDADRKPYAENTALLTNLIQDLEVAELQPHLTMLSLTEILTQMNEANEEFRVAYNLRAEWLFEKEQLGKMPEQRAAVDEAFDAICVATNSLYQANELTTKDAATRQQLADIIDTVNVLIKSFERIYALRTDGKLSDSTGSGNGDGGEKPTDPHNPDNLPEIRISEVKVTNNENLLLRADDPTAFNQYLIDSGYNKAEAPGIVFVEYVKPTEKKLYFYQLDSFEAELDAEMSPIMVGLNLSPSNGKLFVVPFTEDTLANPYDCFLCLDAYTHLALLNVKKPKETLIPPEK